MELEQTDWPLIELGYGMVGDAIDALGADAKWEQVTKLRTENIKLRTAAQAVIDRWDTPLWKDVPATAVFIEQLRAALGE